MITTINFDFLAGDSSADHQGLPFVKPSKTPFMLQLRLAGPAWIAQWRIDLLRGGSESPSGSWLPLLSSQQADRSLITPNGWPPGTVDWSWLSPGFGVPLYPSDLLCTPEGPIITMRLNLDAAAPAKTRITANLFVVTHEDIQS